MEAATFFYVVMVESVVDERDSFIQVFWTWAEDIGSAIESVLATARAEGVKDPVAVELDPYDAETLHDDVYEIEGTGVFTSGGRHFFPTEPSTFRLPDGVILSAWTDEDETEELQTGYEHYKDGDLFHLDAVLPGESLTGAFFALVDSLLAIRVSWVEILEEWEDAGTKQFFADESLTSPEAVRAFLQAEAANILRNGFVKFTVYADEGATNIVINDHKEIGVISRDEGIVRRAAEVLEGLDIPEAESLNSLRQGYYHWHYKPPAALSRPGLIAHLEAAGFYLWKEIEVEAD